VQDFEFPDKIREYYTMDITNPKYINNQQTHFNIYDLISTFVRASWYYQSFVHSPTDTLVSCIRK